MVLVVPPACLLDPSLGTHGFVKANDINFHYVTAGDETKPLMLFLHGFPEVKSVLQGVLSFYNQVTPQ